MMFCKGLWCLIRVSMMFHKGSIMFYKGFMMLHNSVIMFLKVLQCFIRVLWYFTKARRCCIRVLYCCVRVLGCHALKWNIWGSFSPGSAVKCRWRMIFTTTKNRNPGQSKRHCGYRWRRYPLVFTNIGIEKGLL